MKPCRECKHDISEQALACPPCGAPYPVRKQWGGWGFEYRSKLTLWGLSLVHIAFKYRPNRTPVVAKGVIAIGQFGCGFITIAQCGVSIISICQFTVAIYALAQFAIAYSLIAQIGIYLHSGYGQLVKSVAELLKLL